MILPHKVQIARDVIPQRPPKMEQDDDPRPDPIRSEMQRACTADCRCFRNGTTPGSGRFLRCLKQPLSELSPSCRDLVEKRES